MSLLGSLGLDSVESDPNKIADGVYNGVVFKSEYVVHTKNKNKADEYDAVSHVITYQVTDGDRKGAQKAEWFTLGRDPQYDESSPGRPLVGMTPTMSEAAKPWYKKRWVDLGVDENEVASADPKRLIGTRVRFGVKTKDGFQNVSFVEVADGSAQASASASPSAEDIANLI